MEKIINFDMDGTLNQFYNVEGWLDDLIAKNPRPYIIAKPTCNFKVLARKLNMLITKGYKIRIVSWLAKNSTEDFDNKVIYAKQKWLKTHLPSVKFDKIIIVPYGTPKESLSEGILFDDEKNNRDNWNGIAYDVNNILETLKKF